MSEKVSIIIPSFNSEKYIERCILSALAQTYENIEIVIVDDGSTDKTVDICKNFAKDHENILLIKNENHGVSFSRDCGIEKATGKYVFFLDSDDTIDKTAIEKLVKNHKTNELTSIRIQGIYDDKKVESSREEKYSADNVAVKILTDELQGFSCGYLFEKSKCPKFDERTGYCEDVLFLVGYIAKNNIKSVNFLINEDCFYSYYQNEKSATRSKNEILKKLKNAEVAMTILDEKTEHKYTELINNKKNALFEPELDNLSDSKIQEIFDLFKLEKYTGKSLLVKKFSKAYRSGKITRIKRYYTFKNRFLSIIKFLGGAR